MQLTMRYYHKANTTSNFYGATVNLPLPVSAYGRID